MFSFLFVFIKYLICAWKSECDLQAKSWERLITQNWTIRTDTTKMEHLAFSKTAQGNDCILVSCGCHSKLPQSRWLKGFPGGSDGRESACNVGDLASIPGSERSPGGGHGNPLQFSCLESPHGQRSLAGCNPRGHRVGHG